MIKHKFEIYQIGGTIAQKTDLVKTFTLRITGEPKLVEIADMLLTLTHLILKIPKDKLVYTITEIKETIKFQ